MLWTQLVRAIRIPTSGRAGTVGSRVTRSGWKKISGARNFS